MQLGTPEIMAEQRREWWKSRQFLLYPEEQAEILKLWPELADIPEPCTHEWVLWLDGEDKCFACGALQKQRNFNEP